MSHSIFIASIYVVFWTSMVMMVTVFGGEVFPRLRQFLLRFFQLQIAVIFAAVMTAIIARFMSP